MSSPAQQDDTSIRKLPVRRRGYIYIYVYLRIFKLRLVTLANDAMTDVALERGGT